MDNDVSTILYFSPSGSCKLIADFIAEKCNSTKINLTNIAERQNFDLIGNCIFILPVYNGSIPKVCAEYINKLNGDRKSAYIICVYGGVYKGKALQNVASLIKQSGYIPIRGAYIAAPHTYNKNKINEIDNTRLNLIYKKLFDNNTDKTLKISAKPKGWDKQKILKKLTGKCVVNNNCTMCGQCVKVCPVNATGSDLKSNKNCILCGACVKICARNARRVKFFTPIPAIFIKLKCKTRDNEFFNLV